jgi:hypothetical protein
MVEKDRLYDFLAGLDVEYDPIRVQVLGRVPFPSLGEAYACVQEEEIRRCAMVLWYLFPFQIARLWLSFLLHGMVRLRLGIGAGLLIVICFSVTIVTRLDIPGSFAGSSMGVPLEDGVVVEVVVEDEVHMHMLRSLLWRPCRILVEVVHTLQSQIVLMVVLFLRGSYRLYSLLGVL